VIELLEMLTIKNLSIFLLTIEYLLF
jgi:hypothetical protein